MRTVANCILVIVLMGLLATWVYADAASELAADEAKVQKIKNDLSQDPALFNKYAKEKFGLPAGFDKITLLKNARLDGTKLVSAEGATLDLLNLKNIKDLKGVRILSGGNFAFTFADNGQVNVYNSKNIEVTDKGFKIDGVEVTAKATPGSQLNIRPGTNGLKGDEGFFISGKGTLIVGKDSFTAGIPNGKTFMKVTKNELDYVLVPTGKGSSITYMGHKFQAMSGSWYLFPPEPPDKFMRSPDNRLTVFDDKVYARQTSAGKLIVDDTHILDNGNYKISKTKIADLKADKISAITYIYGDKTITGSASGDKIQNAKYLGELFNKLGYGSDTKEIRAKIWEANYERLKAGGKIDGAKFAKTYDASATTNQKFLELIKNEDIPLYEVEDLKYDVNSKRAGVTKVVPDAEDATTAQTTAAKNVLIAKTKATSVTTPGGAKIFTSSELGVQSTFKNAQVANFYQKYLQTLRASGEFTEQEVAKALPDSFVLPSERKTQDPTDDPDLDKKFEKRLGRATHYAPQLVGDPTPIGEETEAWNLGYRGLSEGTPIKLDAELPKDELLGETKSGEPTQVGGIAVPRDVYNDLRSRGIKVVWLEFDDHPDKSGWYKPIDIGKHTWGDGRVWVDLSETRGAAQYVKLVKNSWGSDAEPTFTMYVPKKAVYQPKFTASS